MRMYGSILAALAVLIMVQPARALEEPAWWQVYNIGNSDLPSNMVLKIEADRLGRVWLSSNGLVIFDGTNWKHFGGLTVLQIGIAPDNTAWAACDLFGGTLVHCDGGSITSYTSENSGIPSNWATGVTVDRKNHVWVGCNFTGIGEFDGTTWVKHLSSSETGGGYLVLEHDRDNTIWLGSGHNLYRYQGESWTPIAVPGMEPGKSITDIVCAGDGSIWIGTDTLGVAHYDNGDWAFYSTATGSLPGNRVMATAIDSNGVLWVGTLNGLVSFNGTLWETRTKENWVLPDNAVRAIAVDPGNTLWIGTNNGLLRAEQNVTSVGESANPAELMLSPNPVRDGEVSLRFALSAPAQVEVAVYSSVGGRVAVVAAGEMPAGEHNYTFDSRRLAAGSYYCVVSVAGRGMSRTPFVIHR